MTVRTDARLQKVACTANLNAQKILEGTPGATDLAVFTTRNRISFRLPCSAPPRTKLFTVWMLVFASSPAAPADFEPIGLWRPSSRCLINNGPVRIRIWTNSQLRS